MHDPRVWPLMAHQFLCCCIHQTSTNGTLMHKPR
jgi:hypothetical protein